MSRAGLPTRGHHVHLAPWDREDRLRIDGDAGHHLAAVLRVRVGEALSLADGTGLVQQAEVVERDRGSVTVALGERFEVPAPEVRLCVVQALPKGRKMDEVVQRLTEVGVDRIRPVVTSRAVVQVKGEEKADRVAGRWASIARAAAEQSRRPRLPRIDKIGPWPPGDAVGLLLWEGAETSLPDAWSAFVAGGGGRPGTEVTVAIGPEGGLSAGEVAAAPGLIPCTAGPSILRTETAGLVAAALVGAHLGRYA